MRDAVHADVDAVLALTERLVAFGDPPGRPASEVIEGERRTLRGWFDSPAAGSRLVVAELGPQDVVAFMYLETKADYFTSEPHGHVGILVVDRRAEGHGIGRALLGAARDWSRDARHRCLTLSVFTRNERARTLYERFGFVPETLTLRLDTP
jgi:GNAT superfamily N-acetyltransferase